MTYLDPGIHRIDPSAYHADPMLEPSLSSTLARLIITKSPKHAWTASSRLNPDYVPVEKKTFDIGRAAHREVLGAGDDYVAIPEAYLAKDGSASTKAAKEFIEEMRAAGRTPLKPLEVNSIREMAKACRAFLAEYRIDVGTGRNRMPIVLDPECSELAAFARIEDVNCRALFDNVPSVLPYLIDFKTTTDATPDACMRAAATYGYDVQIAHYLDVWHAITGERRRMILVFQEKDPPFEISVVELHSGDDDADWMASAYDKARMARVLWRRCLDRGEWPGYPRLVARVGAPTWHTAKWENRDPSRETLDRARKWQAPRGDAA